MEFSTEIQKLVLEYNLYSRANTMLYKDKDVAEMFKSLYGIDRFDFVNNCNSISKKLIPLIAPLHGTNVFVTCKDGEVLKGTIEHPLTRMYIDSEGFQRETPNEVAFRNSYGGSEVIALWVNTGNKLTSHLYNAEFIQTEEEYFQDLKNECELNAFESISFEG